MTLDHSIFTATKSHFCSLLKSNIFFPLFRFLPFSHHYIPKHSHSTSLWRRPIVFGISLLKRRYIFQPSTKRHSFDLSIYIYNNYYHTLKHTVLSTHHTLTKWKTPELQIVLLCFFGFVLSFVFNLPLDRTFLCIKVFNLTFHRSVPPFLALL